MIKRNLYFLITITFAFFFLLQNVSASGFTVTSVSSTNVITKQTDPSTVYWVIDAHLDGGGQSISGTVSPDMIKKFMGGKVSTKQTLSINIGSVNEQAFYEVTSEKVPIYKYSATYNDAQPNWLGVITEDAAPCPSGTAYPIAAGTSFWGHVKRRFCVNKNQAGIKGTYENPISSFKANIVVSAGGISKSKTICSGAISGCDGSSVSFDDLGTATWTGSLVTGESPPNQDNYVAIQNLNQNKWNIARKSTWDQYNPTQVSIDSQLNSLVYNYPEDMDAALNYLNNILSQANQAADTLLSEDVSFTSSSSKDSNTGKVTVTLDRRLTSPDVVFRIRADWLGIVIPSGKPQILNINSNNLVSGESGEVDIQVQNVGDAEGTFSAMLMGCEPFVSSTTAETSRKTIQPGNTDTIKIKFSGGVVSDDITKTCSVKVYDVNDPSVETSSNVDLSLEKAKVCTPNEIFSEGNIIKKCNGDGSDSEIVKTCKKGIIKKDSGDLDCSGSSTVKEPLKCSEGEVTAMDNSKCINVNDLIGYPSDTSCTAGWPNHQGETVSINEQNYACDLFEVNNNQLKGISQEVATCFSSKCGDSSCNAFCKQAYKQSGADYFQNTETFKKFAGLYLIYGLGPAAEFMRNYFNAEINCGSGSGTCSPKDGYNNNVQQLQCKSQVGQPEGWLNDSDMSSNSCLFSDLPAHVNIDILHTGTCVDYSVSLTTLLRYAGYKDNEVYSVTAPGHEYNLVKFPGDRQYTIVDTVGNSISFGKGWSWSVGDRTINHCDYILSSCANDNGQGNCPAKSEVKEC